MPKKTPHRRRATRSTLRLQPTNNQSIVNPGTSVGEGTPTDRALRHSTLTFEETPIDLTSPVSSSPSPAPSMAYRSRNGRGGVRGGKEEGQELLMWNDIRDAWFNLKDIAAQSDRLAKQIIELEAGIKAKELAGQKPSLQELDALSNALRQSVRVADEAKSVSGDSNSGMIERLQILKGLTSANESLAIERGSSSRDMMSKAAELDGSGDSPIPSPADSKQARKFGQGRTSSQPPKDKDTPIKTEHSEEREPTASSSRANTKIQFSLGAQVAFKPKIPGQQEEHDWIQGIVVKVIGEGKSRRYDVKDPYPDDGKEGETYRSSASSMVPIPPLGQPLPDYEVGKRVLALYPETTTFYRAEVKAMVDDGNKVRLLFEDDGQGVYKEVERRFVLDHKG